MSDEQQNQDAPEEPQEAPQAAPQPYRESEDHVPDPTAFSGTLETSGTGGGRHARLEGVAEVFDGVTQQTVERDGLAEHQGAIVQDDTTGVPAVTNEQRVNDAENPLYVEENPLAVERQQEQGLAPEDGPKVTDQTTDTTETGGDASESPTPKDVKEVQESADEESKSVTPAKKTAAKKAAAADPKK